MLESIVVTIIIAGVVIFTLAIRQLYKDNCECNRGKRGMEHNNKRKSIISKLKGN